MSASILWVQIWQRTEHLWALRALRRETSLWEAIEETFGVLDVWQMRATVLDVGSRAARATRMVSAMRIRAEVEYGEAATDAASLRELELGCMGGRDRLQLT